MSGMTRWPAEDCLDGFGIERRAVVAFEEEWRPVLLEELIEVSGDFRGGFGAADERRQAVFGSEVLHRDEAAEFGVFGAVDGPGGAGGH